MQEVMRLKKTSQTTDLVDVYKRQDYAALRDAVGQYLSAFRERTPELERSGPKLVYILSLIHI